MNRGYTAYLKESKLAVKESFKRKGSYIKYYVWAFMVLLGKLFILPNSAMDLSIVKQSKNVLNNRQISVFNCFENTFKPKPFFSLFIARLLYLFFVIALILVIGILCLALYSFCLFAVLALEIDAFDYVIVLITIPVCILLVCLFVSIFFRAAPMSYVAYSDNDIQPSSVLTKSFKAMDKGKFIIFLNRLRIVWFNLLFLVTFMLGIIVFEYLATTFLFGYGCIFNDSIAEGVIAFNNEMNIDLILPISSEVFDTLYAFVAVIELGLIIYGIIALLKLNARLTLINYVSRYALFEDLVDDKFNQNKVAVGVYVKNCKNKKIKDKSLKEIFESSSSVECEVSSPVVEKRVLKDLTNEITLDEELNLSLEKNSSEVAEWVF